MKSLKTILCLCICIIIAYPAFASDCQKAQEISEQGAGYIESSPSMAINSFNQAVDLCPDSLNMRYNLALAHYKAGNNQQAQQEFLKIVNLNSQDAGALNALAVIYLEQNNGTKALELARSAMELDPGNPNINDTFAKAEITVIAMNPSVHNPPKTLAWNPDAIAVVIGNRDYQNKDIPSVDFAINDSATVKKYLVNVLGFKPGNIIYVENASKAKFESIFGNRDSYKARLYSYLKKGKSDIFVFYSGHGAPDIDSRRGYFVPSDAEANIIAITGYSLDTFYENITKISEEMKSPNVTIVIDACFSGATEGGLIMKNASPITIEFKNPILKSENIVVMTAASGSELSSWYPEQEHGLFTYFFLKALMDRANQGDLDVTAGELFATIEDKTEGLPYLARRLYQRIQTPQLQGNKEIRLIKQ